MTLDRKWKLDGATENLKYRLWGRKGFGERRFLVTKDTFEYNPDMGLNSWTGMLPEMSVLDVEIFGKFGKSQFFTVYVLVI